MDIVQVIGFLISLLVLFFFMVKSIREERYRRQHPEEYRKEKEEQTKKLKEFLRSLEVDMEDQDQFKAPAKPAPPVLPARSKQKKGSAQTKNEAVGSKPKSDDTRTSIADWSLKTNIEERQLKTNIEDRQLKTNIEDHQFKTTIETRYHDPFGQRVVPLDVRKQAAAPSYHVIGREGDARGKKLLSSLKSPKQMVILHEIIGKPKAFQ